MDKQVCGDIDNKNIGERIRKQREDFGLTREKLAEIIELSPLYIGQLERGERQMSLNTLYKLAQCFHVSTDYLIKGEESWNKGDAKGIISLTNRCSDKEIVVIEEVIKVILPHIKK